MFLTEYDEKETMRRQARDNREEGRKEGREEERTALKKATEYLKEHGRDSEIEKLNLDDDFFAAVIKEAGIEFEGLSEQETE